ncbi:energy transducer TonB [uncultured Arenimonas sp.]|uniref:energy transducer TonB n=1 Tax=uncultured Arenimonas sp. TaxID=546226 RepID=UPI0030D94B61
MIDILFALALAMPAPPVEAPAAAATAAVECPAPRMVQPRYPVKEARANKTGLVLVGARFDDCGRVTETRVDKSSGITAFDESALASVAAYVLSPGQREKARDGWIQAPVKFGGFRTVVPVSIPWPRSHRRPMYIKDDEPFPFESIQAFQAAAPDSGDKVYKPPYAMGRDPEIGLIHTSLVPDARDPSVFWFRYTVQPPRPASPTAPPPENIRVGVARYRLVEEQGVPVVRLAILCERSADECQRLEAFLFEGLPFAKARRR